MGLGIHAGYCPRLGGAVQLWPLQFDAAVPDFGIDRHGFVQATLMVCILPHGNHDAGHLQIEKQRKITHRIYYKISLLAV